VQAGQTFCNSFRQLAESVAGSYGDNLIFTSWSHYSRLAPLSPPSHPASLGWSLQTGGGPPAAGWLPACASKSAGDRVRVVRVGSVGGGGRTTEALHVTDSWQVAMLEDNGSRWQCTCALLHLELIDHCPAIAEAASPCHLPLPPAPHLPCTGHHCSSWWRWGGGSAWCCCQCSCTLLLLLACACAAHQCCLQGLQAMVGL
jgi:hypothetical protein